MLSYDENINIFVFKLTKNGNKSTQKNIYC